MGRILALDYGRRRIGLAMSDPLQCIAQPFDTWKNTSLSDIVRQLSRLIVSHNVELIVIGLPITMSGERKTLAKEVTYFATVIRKKLELPVDLWDERLTSVQAKRSMIALNEKPSRYKEKVDRIAAMLILQNYMDAHPKTLLTKSEETD